MIESDRKKKNIMKKLIKVYFLIILNFAIIVFLIWKIFLKEILGVGDLIYVWGVLLLGFFAVTNDAINRECFKPELEIHFSQTHPYCHITKMKHTKSNGVEIFFPVYYCRFAVKNKRGRRQANNCEAVLEKIWINNKEEKNFSPVNLSWVVPEEPSQYIQVPQFVSLGPGREIFCDIGFIIHKDYYKLKSPAWILAGEGHKFMLELRKRFFAQRDCISPGEECKIRVAIYSENAEKIEKTFTIKWSGEWKDEEPEILKEITIN